MLAALRRLGSILLIICGTLTAALLIALGAVLWGMHGSGSPPADCAIVFGAGVQPLRNASGAVIGSTAGPGILRRTETAARLYKDGQIHTLYLSGGKGEGMLRSEAAVMKSVALRAGVRAGDIVLEDHSRSTRENLLNTRPLTQGCKSVLAISDGYHLSRIRFLAWQQGWNLQTYPADEAPVETFLAWSIGREVLGILFYSVN